MAYRVHRLVVFAVLALIILVTVSQFVITKAQQSPVYLVLIWHYHQPWYTLQNDSFLLLPWVRLHSAANYFKMGYILSKYPDIKATFTFSGSLLYQIALYLNGSMDHRLAISKKIAEGREPTTDEKFDMLRIPGGFFDINWNRIVNVVPRFRELRDKAQQAFNKYIALPEPLMKEKVVSEFTDQDFVDLATLFNLFWIDYSVAKELYPDIYEMQQKALSTASIHFTRDDLKKVLDVHYSIMSRIFSLYSELAKRGQIEIILVPYSHPLAPIVADLGFAEDLYIHVEKSLELFNRYLNYTPKGIWPAEQAVNDYVLKVFTDSGFLWTVTDQSILTKSGVADPAGHLTLWYAEFNGKRIYVLFRDTELGNLISFTYSTWKLEQAVEDFISSVKQLGSRCSAAPCIVVVALDGENPWEHYESWGDTFLTLLYQRLSEEQRKGTIITATPAELISMFGDKAKKLPYGPRLYLALEGVDISDIPIQYFQDAYDQLPRRTVNAYLAEGSWAGGELAVWIGQRQENVAWMWLAKARQDMLKALGVTSIRDALAKNPKAVEYLLRAEASDWWWWYGGEMGGGFPANPFFKTYLSKIYESLGLPVPKPLRTVFNPDATPVFTINSAAPKPLTQRIIVDGKLEPTWSTALNMSVGSIVKSVLVAVDSDNMYLAIIPGARDALTRRNMFIAVYTTSWWRSVSPFMLSYNSFSRDGKDLGMSLFYEIAVFPQNSTAIISAATGDERWVPLYRLPVAVGNVIEVAVPWFMIGLRPGDLTYITVAVYINGSVAETATRLGGVYQVLVPRVMGAVAGEKVIADIRDPEGDDNGAGTYVYPKNPVFVPGAFDIIRFRVVDAEESIRFETYVKELGGNPWGGPNGFSLQYIHIYIRTTSTALPFNKTTFGLNVVLDNDSAWQIAILVAPGWGTDPVPKGEKAALYYSNGTVIVQDGVLKVYVDTSTNAIIAEIKKSALIDVDNIDKWVVTVALTSYDGYGSQKIRSFGVDAQEWVVGVGKEHALAVASNVVPRIMDFLAPTKEEQYRMLTSYKVDIVKGVAEPAVIHGIRLGAVQAPQTQTTVTVTTTTTITQTVEKTPTTTVLIATTLPQTITTTLVATVTEVRTDWVTASVMVIVTLLIGIAVGYLIKRTK